LLDASGNEVWVVRIDGTNVGFAYPEGTPPTNGDVFNAVDTRDGAASDSLDQTTPSQEAYAQMACFVAGTLIRTPSGEVPVERLARGDLVSTLDNGPQPLLWTGRRFLDRVALQRAPQFKPVLIPAGVLGNRCDLLVSPLHCVLMGPAHGLDRSMLVRARHLAEHPGPVRVAHGRKQVTYHHILFAAHQIVFSEGTASESFYPGPAGMKSLVSADRLGILAMFPRLLDDPTAIAYGPTARPVCKRGDLSTLGKLTRKPKARKTAVSPFGD
ncbi:MAG: Hint domain-containing protein, partial [Paracoccaceae bacterium]|nr:Hint domain-containing protein [Paracoccaceae bacterium]